jgi:glycosyltransferase involved in cell wall biosynthesis
MDPDNGEADIVAKGPEPRRAPAASQPGPPISVVIPTYNRAALLPRAIRSAIAATRSDDEIIVVDDGSSDATSGVLSEFAGRIRVVRGAHRGAGAARNLGVELAVNRWVAFLDSDDEWDADKLALQRPLLGRFDDVAFVFTNFRGQLPDGTIEGNYLPRWNEDARSPTQMLGVPRLYSELAELPAGREDFAVYKGGLYRELLFRSYLAAFTYLFRKDLGDSVPTFAEDLPTLEDLQFFARVAKLGDGLYLDCESATQHAHEGPRLSVVPELDVIESRLATTRRVWGNDAAFLRTESESYHAVCRRLEQRRDFLRGRLLAFQGRLDEARAAMTRAGTIPWKYRLLFRLPDTAIRFVLLLFGLLAVDAQS